MFDPQEVLDRSVGIAAMHTGSLVECSYFRFDGVHHLPGGGSKSLAIQVCDFLAHDPVSHWVDIGADDVTPQAIGFQQRRATAHKGVADDEGAQVVAAEKAIRQRLFDAKVDPTLISIDTVERYQGSARDIIILSLSQNTRRQIYSLSIPSDEGIDRKLNVALTRARKQIILIGNEKILNSMDIYRDLILWMKGEKAMG